jgi:nucleotidyltransferase/DNA polymerase involved in DNA repair
LAESGTWVACVVLPTISIACERARLPHLWGEPVALAAADGMLKAVSPECFPFGIEPAQTRQAARSLCVGLIVLPYDRETYMRAAEVIWNLIAVETSVVEPVEPEEIYAELTGADQEVCERARQIATLINSDALLDVRIGLGKTKLVARRAALQDKRTSNVVAVPLGREAAAIASLALVSLPNPIDARLLQRLEMMGVRTLGDVLALPESVLHRHRKLREVWHLLRRLAVGDDDQRVRPLWPKPKIERSFRFEEETRSEQQVHAALRRLAQDISKLLEGNRSGEVYCRSLMLIVGIAARYVDETERLIFPTHDPEHIYAASLRLFSRLRTAHLVDAPVAELILIAYDLDSGSQQQLAFSSLDEESAKREQRARLEGALGRIWRRYGARAVITASLLAQARRIHLLTHTLAKLRAEPIRVYTDRQGAPQRYLRRSRLPGRRKEIDTYEVAAILDTWRVSDWQWGRLIERDCWRVAANPDGIHELHRLGVEWVLQAEAD